MRQNQLETYLVELEKGLRSLPPSERERELAEAQQHLEALVAARCEAGQAMETATEEAIRQFGNAQENGARLRQAARRGRLKNLPPLVVVALYSLAASALFGLIMRWGINPAIRLLFTEPNQRAAQNAISHAPAILPSMVLGIATLAFLFFQVGVGGSIRTAFSRTSLAGTAVFYLLSRNVANLVLYSLFIPFLTNPTSYSGPTGISSWLNGISFATALLAGWWAGVRSKNTPSDTTKTVVIVALLGPLMGILNLLANPAALNDAFGFVPTFLWTSLPQYLCVPLAAFGAHIGVKMRQHGPLNQEG